MKKEKVVLLIYFIFGIIFRLWFISLKPQGFGFDQYEYERFAVQILNLGIYAESARLYGYPLFIAFIYKLFGIGNIFAIYIFQAIIDSITAILVYKLATLLFRKTSIASFACILYLINPFTSAFIGVMLSEILGIFLTTLLLYISTLYFLKKSFLNLLLLCFTAGFLPQVRPVFLYFSGILMACSVYIYIQSNVKKKTLGALAGITLFIIPFLYTLIGNVIYFHEWKLTGVDHILPRELFISIKVPNRAPYHIENGWDVYPKEVMSLYGEYSLSPKNKHERQLMADKYSTLAVDLIKKNPWLFIQQRLGKMFFVWEKNFVWYYDKNPNDTTDHMIYWINILVLITGFSGLAIWARKTFIHNKKKLIATMFLFLYIYISVAHCISLAEDRYSLPGYPFLFIFAAYFVKSTLTKISIKKIT